MGQGSVLATKPKADAQRGAVQLRESLVKVAHDIGRKSEQVIVR